jgi:hypothetical protein
MLVGKGSQPACFKYQLHHSRCESDAPTTELIAALAQTTITPSPTYLPSFARQRSTEAKDDLMLPKNGPCATDNIAVLAVHGYLPHLQHLLHCLTCTCKHVQTLPADSGGLPTNQPTLFFCAANLWLWHVLSALAQLAPPALAAR